MSLPVLLGGYAAKSCARAAHNAYDPTIAAPPSEISPELQRLFDLGIVHERTVFDLALDLVPEAADLREHQSDKRRHIELTLEAMAAGRVLILGGRLPDDPSGARTGKPDLLVKDLVGDGYHPGDVKAHLVLDRKRTGGLVGGLSHPSLADATPGKVGLQHDLRDLLQLAHYWRMLEACGHSPTATFGCIVGTDPGFEPQLAWYDLSEPRFTTFSRRHGRAARNALERYDHEHGFRVRVAKTAQQQTGSPGAPVPLVEPLGQDECLTCAWAPVCVDLLPTGDLSRELLGALSVREYLALRKEGIKTLDDLANADIDALLRTGYAEQTNQQHARDRRLYKAHMSAQLAREGTVLRLKQDATFDVPGSAVEVDIDIECNRDGLVYLWGLLITRGTESSYHFFGDPSVTTPEAEARITADCFDWLTLQAQGAQVFHYAPVEKTHARRILGETVAMRRGGPADPDTWFDLLPPTRACFDSRSGHGLKVIATEGAGFHWRDEDPGGLQSQHWLEQASTGDPQAWRRILDYNEDDVRATLAVRRFLRFQTNTALS